MTIDSVGEVPKMGVLLYTTRSTAELFNKNFAVACEVQSNASHTITKNELRAGCRRKSRKTIPLSRKSLEPTVLTIAIRSSFS